MAALGVSNTTKSAPPEHLHVLQCGDSYQPANALNLANAVWAARHGHSYTYAVEHLPRRAPAWCKIRLLHATLKRLVASQQKAVVLFLDNDAVVSAEGSFIGGKWLRQQGHAVAAPLDDGDDIGDDMSDRLRDVFQVDPLSTTQMLREFWLRKSDALARGTLTHDFYNTGVILADASRESVAFFARLWEEGNT